MPVLKQDSVTEFIKQRVVSGLHLGLLAPGERLPSVRELSAELKADPRVVVAACRRLEKEGLVVVRERSGIFVAPKKSRTEAGPPDLIVDAFVDGFNHGVSPMELPDLMRRSLAPLSRRAMVLECNDDQLFSISGELRRDFGMDVQTFDVTASTSGTRAVDFQSADVFITTGFHAADAQKLSERYGIPAIVVTMCTDLFAGVRQRLEKEPVYFVVTDPRFARKLQSIFVESNAAANLHVLVNGRDDLSSIPAGVATYVTQITRKALRDLPFVQRLIPEAHVFSPDSAREILSFLVKPNPVQRAQSYPERMAAR